jgi:TolB protein
MTFINGWFASVRRSSRAAGLGGILALAGLFGLQACSDSTFEPSTRTGTVEASVATTGEDPDPDGYVVVVGDSIDRAVGPNESARIENVPSGQHTVFLDGVADNCQVEGENPRTVTVPEDGTVTASMTVTCEARLGDLEARASTTGDELDPDGYRIVINGGTGEASGEATGANAEAEQTIGPNDTVLFGDLPAKAHEVELQDVASNCTVEGRNPRTVEISFGEQTSVTFEVHCESTRGGVNISTSTSGQDTDPDGYNVGVHGLASANVAANGSTSLDGLPEGEHELELRDVASNCTVEGDNPRTIDIVAGTSVDVTFEVTCVERQGQVRVDASTTGEDVDPDGYTVTLDGGSEQSLAVDGSVTFDGVDEGSHDVRLGDVADNCTVGGDNPRTVSVSHGQETAVTFDVTCEAVANQLTAETSTTGEQLDPDGYTLSLDGGDPEAVGIDDSRTWSDLSNGDHTVELGDIAANCWVDGANPRTVNLSAGESVTTTFSVKCFAPLSDEIAFEGEASGNLDIYVIDADGSGSASRLTTFSGRDRDPHVSPDGTTILCSSARSPAGLWLINADGTNPRYLTDGSNGKWSPDGSKILFTRGGSSRDIYVINADGTGVRQVTDIGGFTDLGAWSPDGATLAFTSDLDGDLDIYTVSAGASGAGVADLTQLTDNPGVDGNPTWSSTGKIAFTRWADPDGTRTPSDPDDDHEEVYVMNADGSSQVNLTESSDSHDGYAAWSKGGSLLAIYSDRTGGDRVYVMNADGTDLVQITTFTSRAPAWSP